MTSIRHDDRPRPDLAQTQRTPAQSVQQPREQERLREAQQVEGAAAEPAAPAAPPRAMDPTR